MHSLLFLLRASINPLVIGFIVTSQHKLSETVDQIKSGFRKFISDVPQGSILNTELIYTVS